MTWAEAGQLAAMAGVALAGWFGFWTMADRRFAELRAAIDRTNGAIDRANERNDKAHGELRAAIDRTNGAIDRANERNDKAHEELRGAIDRANERNDKAHGELRAAIDRANERNDKAHEELRNDIKGLVASVNDVKVTVTGVQKDVQYLRRDLDSLTPRRDGDDAEGHRP